MSQRARKKRDREMRGWASDLRDSGPCPPSDWLPKGAAVSPNPIEEPDDMVEMSDGSWYQRDPIVEERRRWENWWYARTARP